MKINVDSDIYKKIENGRRRVNETDNEVLRRLLGLPELTTSRDSTMKKVGPSFIARGGHPWRYKGVELPEGTELRFDYVDHENIYGVIRNGKWDFDGKTFDTPSCAACHFAGVSLNGWMYWEVRFPGDPSWRSLNSFRKKVDRRS